MNPVLKMMNSVFKMMNSVFNGQLLLTELISDEGGAVINCEVGFQWKNPDFPFKNPDFLLKNDDFTIMQVLNTATTAVDIDPLGGTGSAQVRFSILKVIIFHQKLMNFY